LENLPLRMRPDEVAAHLNVTAEHVISLIRSGALAAVNVGTGTQRQTYRVTKESLIAFVERHRE
jgi:excisionase family DNA binding protein